jgi:hypothetical protein
MDARGNAQAGIGYQLFFLGDCGCCDAMAGAPPLIAAITHAAHQQ